MRDINWIIGVMDMEFFITQKEVSMPVNGSKIKCKVEELYITQMIKLLMKENGSMISFMVLEYSTIKFQVIHLIPSIINPFIWLTTIGPNMKETFQKMRKMVRELYSFLTVNIIEGLLKKDYLMEAAFLKQSMEIL